MEGAMLKANLSNKSVPKVELDQRAREGRLRLEQIERLLVIPRAAVTHSWLRRLLFLLRVRISSRELLPRRVKGPLSDRRPSRMLTILAVWCLEGVLP
jgi:hypothetical protein